jgi:hypothetical protein
VLKRQPKGTCTKLWPISGLPAIEQACGLFPGLIKEIAFVSGGRSLASRFVKEKEGGEGLRDRGTLAVSDKKQVPKYLVRRDIVIRLLDELSPLAEPSAVAAGRAGLLRQTCISHACAGPVVPFLFFSSPLSLLLLCCMRALCKCAYILPYSIAVLSLALYHMYLSATRSCRG